MKRQWWTLLVVCAATFMLLLDVTIVAVALPDIQHSLDADFSGLQWTTDAYALSLAALLLTSGSLADLYGRRLLFVIGLAVFTGGSLLCGIASDQLMLVGSRALQGIGGAILFATSLALLASTFQGRERGVAFGVWGSVAGIATALGPVLGGVITSGISWRGIFLVNLPIGIAALAITVRLVDESRPSRASRVDWLGIVPLTVGLFSLVYALIRASDTAWSERGVLICFGLASVFLAAFVVIESRVSEPMFDLSLLRTPTFLGGSIAAFAMNASLFAMFIYLVFYLQNGLGYSAMATGARLLASSGCTLVAAMAAGRLLNRVPTRWLIGPGLVLVGIGLLLMTGVTAGSEWTHLIPGLVVTGIGAGMVNPPLASTAIGVVPVYRAGMASGVNQTFRQVGIAVGIALYGSIFTSSLRDALRERLAGIPGMQGRTDEIADAVRMGVPGKAIAAAPQEIRGQVDHAVHAGFAASMNDLLVASGILAMVGGVLAFFLIRAKDFVAPQPPGRPAASQPQNAGAPRSG
ncbi:MFS transporter [Streptomyces poonensis]|uniref:MFS transporter n=1 Tax=Streptomyces poonensis TaxID=68255 RepID=A0A918QAV1_9ACTN|nr:MFS transporter [Streptomyces poonensis]GGZ40110.1 MFS transporter [Streptomyces poonensis]GLJ92865.1 MFS transporter [Streptomyces poonensis]